MDYQSTYSKTEFVFNSERLKEGYSGGVNTMCCCICTCLGPGVSADGSVLIGSSEDFRVFINRIWFSCSEMGVGVGSAIAGVCVRA